MCGKSNFLAVFATMMIGPRNSGASNGLSWQGEKWSCGVCKGRRTTCEGTEVWVEPLMREEGITVEGPTLAERFADVIGAVPDLPSDMAAQHDHCLYGVPKR
jgi:hypothetical protein